MTPQTTLSGSSPWAGLIVHSTPKTAKERSLAPRKKPPTIETRSQRTPVKTRQYTNIPVGESRHCAVLKEEQALEIFAAMKKYRKLKAEIEKVSPAALSKKYGVHSKTITSIESGRCWNYVTGAANCEGNAK